jgi:hypothetical protein
MIYQNILVSLKQPSHSTILRLSVDRDLSKYIVSDQFIGCNTSRPTNYPGCWSIPEPTYVFRNKYLNRLFFSENW